MGAAVSITRLDLTASELRKAASGEKNSAAARRILALALVLDGLDRKTAAETCPALSWVVNLPVSYGLASVRISASFPHPAPLPPWE